MRVQKSKNILDLKTSDIVDNVWGHVLIYMWRVWMMRLHKNACLRLNFLHLFYVKGGGRGST